MDKKYLSIISVLMIIFVCSFTLISCTSKTAETTAGVKTSTETTTAAEAAQGGYKIAVVVKDSTIEWFVRMEEGVKKYAEDTGNNAFQKGPAKIDAAAQVQVLTDLVAQDLDALCVVPTDPATLEPILREALDKGIVVITHEASFQENTMYDIEAFKNASFGANMMDIMAKAMGETGTYTTMVAHLTNASHNEWMDGAVARQLEAYPNMKLLKDDPRIETEGTGEIAYEKAKELFKKYPGELKGILTAPSDSNPGNARAVEELGLQGKITLVGVGTPNNSREWIKKGLITAILLWDPADAGYAMCKLSEKILKGEEIKEPVDLGVKGYNNLTFAPDSKKVLIGEGWLVVNKDNVDDFNF